MYIFREHEYILLRGQNRLFRTTLVVIWPYLHAFSINTAGLWNTYGLTSGNYCMNLAYYFIVALVCTLIRIHFLFLLLAGSFWLRLSGYALIPCRKNPTRCQMIHIVLWVACELPDISLFFIFYLFIFFIWQGSMRVRRNVGSIHSRRTKFFSSAKRLHWPWPPPGFLSVSLFQGINRPACEADKCRVGWRLKTRRQRCKFNPEMNPNSICSLVLPECCCEPVFYVAGDDETVSGSEGKQTTSNQRLTVDTAWTSQFKKI